MCAGVHIRPNGLVEEDYIGRCAGEVFRVISVFLFLFYHGKGGHNVFG